MADCRARIPSRACGGRIGWKRSGVCPLLARRPRAVPTRPSPLEDMTGAPAVPEVKDRCAASPRSLQTRSTAQHDLLARDAAVKAAMKISCGTSMVTRAAAIRGSPLVRLNNRQLGVPLPRRFTRIRSGRRRPCVNFGPGRNRHAQPAAARLTPRGANRDARSGGARPVAKPAGRWRPGTDDRHGRRQCRVDPRPAPVGGAHLCLDARTARSTEGVYGGFGDAGTAGPVRSAQRA
jgi:hypothetical protein